MNPTYKRASPSSGQFHRTSWLSLPAKVIVAEHSSRYLQRQNFQTFLPLHEKTKRRAGRFASTLRPLFAGYMFVAFDTAKGGWRAINSTYGVSRLVSFGDEPQPVPLDLISRLMLRCDAGGMLLPPRILQPGDAVRISGGPFSEFVATVEKISPDQRVRVLLDLMDRTTRVAVQTEALQVVRGRHNTKKSGFKRINILRARQWGFVSTSCQPVCSGASKLAREPIGKQHNIRW